MTITSNIYLTGTITGKPLGSEQIAKTITGTVYGVVAVVLQAGANTITTPTTGTSGCIIQLSPSNTSIVTLKGVAGDTGIAIGKTTTTMINWDNTAAPASFVLNSVSTQIGLTTYIEYF
jgi:hypothetical protein